MFGEDVSESPRLASPWQAYTQAQSAPSPLRLSTPSADGDGRAGATPDRLTSPVPFRGEDLTAEMERAIGALSLEDGGISLPASSISDNYKRALVPEVDENGNIEYKLKLPTPTRLRLAKLTTQLKFRMIEGGGVALYELGVLDDGTLLGLAAKDMQESLETLKSMVRGVGGGTVRIGRVVRIEADSETVEGEFSSGAEHELFRSFRVDETGDDATPSPSPATNGSTADEDAATFFTLDEDGPERKVVFREPLKQGKGVKALTYHPTRSPEERSAFKRAKREARRLKYGTNGADSPSPEASQLALGGKELVVPALAKAAPPEQVETPKLKFLREGLSRPAPGEVRYAVEAIVTRSESQGKASSGDEDDEDGVGEGWTYLNFQDAGSL